MRCILPTVDILLQNYPYTTDAGVIGFCSDPHPGDSRCVLVDPGHVGRRIYIELALKRQGVTFYPQYAPGALGHAWH